MKNSLAWLGCFLALTAASAKAQSVPPVDLMQAMYCITTNNGGWLQTPLSGQKQWLASAAHDRMGYPHEDRMIVVVYETASKGQAFDLSIIIVAGRRRFNIQNNGIFDMDKGRASFVDPSPDGNLKKGRLDAWLREALHQERYMLRATMLRPAARLATCASYATNK
jgi:hypothetical protein